MMKKLLMLVVAFMATTTAMFADDFPVISITGSSTALGWGGDYDMATTDGVNYTYSGLVVTVPSTDPGVKFRKDHGWTTNWGAASFPTGTGAQNGANIPATDGTWDVTFNYTTGAYAFTPAGATYDTITLVGGGASYSLATGDGVAYSVDNLVLSEGDYYFSINGVGNIGNVDFPSGTGMEGVSVSVPAGVYNITFDHSNWMYNFGFPTISLVGSAVDPEWAVDLDLETGEGIYYFAFGVTLASGEAKFRQNHNWDINWGAADFPTGYGTQDGANIMVVAGEYDIMFNRLTGEYLFSSVEGYPTLTLEGEGITATFATTDGLTYTANAVAITEGSYSLAINGSGQWGGDFPSDTATENTTISIPTGNYNITVDGDTGEYMFSPTVVSLIGSAIDADWTIDIDLDTEDGNYYSKMDVTLADGDIKFRQNHGWGVSWGGTIFTADAAVENGSNIPAMAGTYNVMFDRIAGQYSFTSTAGLTTIVKNSIVVYPNPSNTVWNFAGNNGVINNITVTDVTGKIVCLQAVNSAQTAVNANGLAIGVYFAKVSTATGTTVIRVVKN